MSLQKATLIYFAILLPSYYQPVTSDPFHDLLQQFIGKNIAILSPQLQVPFKSLREGTCSNQKVEVKCMNCTAQLVCDGTSSSGEIILCPTLYPYCDPEGVRCSSVPSLNCTDNPVLPDPNALSCSGSGYFPSPDDCSRYYVCHGIGSSPYRYQCPVNMVYDASLMRCKTKKYKSCATLKCDLSTRNPVTVHPIYPQYFGLCNTYNMTLETAVAVLRCPNSFTYNPKTNACEFKCRKTGYFPGSDGTKFILCYRVGSKLKYIEETCPPGLVYDTVNSNCVNLAGEFV